MGWRQKIQGKEERNEAKAAADAVAGLVGVGTMLTPVETTYSRKVKIVPEGVLVETTDYGAGLGFNQEQTRDKLESAGLQVDAVDEMKYRRMSGKITGGLLVSTEKNGGFSGIADLMASSRGAAQPQDAGFADKLAAERQSGSTDRTR